LPKIIAILIFHLLYKILSVGFSSPAQIGPGLFILPISNIQKENFLGSFLMVVAMAAFAVEDSIIKHVSSLLPVGQILFLLGVGGALTFSGLALILRKEICPNGVFTTPMHFRVISEITGRVFYSSALALTPLASSTMILQATPLVVVVGAAVLFKEKVSALRWVAVLLGFFGVLIIIDPGSESFSFLSILAVLGMFGFAGRDLASRAVPKSLNIFALGVHGFMSIALSGIVLTLYYDAPIISPDFRSWLYLFLGVFLGTIGYSALISAMRIGEVSAITPFRYSRVIFGLAISIFFFGESITLTAALGCGLIILSSFIVLQPKTPG
jgi:drug/metabolite transporter (DMT)-like permease